MLQTTQIAAAGAAGLHHVLAAGGQPVEILHIEEDAHGRRILVELDGGTRRFVAEAEIAASPLYLRAGFVTSAAIVAGTAAAVAL